MRKPAGVVVAAVLLGLGALFGAFTAVLGLAFPILRPSPELPGAVHATMISTAAMELCGFIFCLWTSIGLLRLRPWARVAAIAIAGFTCFLCLTGGIGLLFLRGNPALMPATPHPSQVMAVLTGMAVCFLLLAFIGAWWLLYFNLAPARRAFAASSAAPDSAMEPSNVPLAPRTPGSRIVLVAWSWLMLFSVLSVPMVLWMHTPMFLFGAILRGWAATLTLLALRLAEIYMAVGLLRRWKPAWYLGMAFQVYAVGYTAALLLPGMRGRFQLYMHEAMNTSAYGTTLPAALISGRFFAFCMSMGMLIVILFTWALIQRRNDYLRA